MNKIVLLLATFFCCTLTLKAANYGLYVAGKQVSDTNKADILGNGAASYDPASQTLTLNNAKITTSDAGFKNSGIDNLKIELKGNNTITSSSTTSAAYIERNTTIFGSGSLTLTNSRTSSVTGFYIKDYWLTIEGTSVTVSARAGAFSGASGTGNLAVNNATVSATATMNGAIFGLRMMTMTNCAISQPEGAEFVSSLKGVAKNGTLVKGTVVISPTTEVANIANNNVKIYATNRTLTVENPQNEAISVFNLMGQMIFCKQNASVLELFDLPNTGIYIVKVGNKTSKIVSK